MHNREVLPDDVPAIHPLPPRPSTRPLHPTPPHSPFTPAAHPARGLIWPPQARPPTIGSRARPFLTRVPHKRGPTPSSRPKSSPNRRACALTTQWSQPGRHGRATVPILRLGGCSADLQPIFPATRLEGRRTTALILERRPFDPSPPAALAAKARQGRLLGGPKIKIKKNKMEK